MKIHNYIKSLFNLHYYNEETIKFEPIKFKSYFVWILFLLIIGGGFGFSSSFKANNAIEKIPIIIKIWKDEKKEFHPDKLKGYINEMNFKYPDVVYAQAVLESNNFKSEIFKHNHNLFGMKMSQSRTTTNQGNQLNYAIYEDWESSLIDRALWEEAYTRNISKEQYLDLLNNIYAEDGSYKIKLLKIIKDYGL